MTTEERVQRLLEMRARIEGRMTRLNEYFEETTRIENRLAVLQKERDALLVEIDADSRLLKEL